MQSIRESDPISAIQKNDVKSLVMAEAGVVIHEEFREGNIAPAAGNLEFIKDCETRLLKGLAIADSRIRPDSTDQQAG